MEKADYPHLSRLVDTNELWEHVRDFDHLLSQSKKDLPDAIKKGDAAEIAQQLHQLAFEHFYLTLVFRFKAKEIARGVFAAVTDENYVVLFNLARAFMEHTASLAYQGEALQKAINDISTKQNTDQIQGSISAHRKVTQRLYYGGEGSPSHVRHVHVNDLLKSLDRIYENALQRYASLCEFVHPNYGSNTLVSSGKLASGEIGTRPDSLLSESQLAQEVIERCAEIDSQLMLTSTRSLVKLGNWIANAGRSDAKLSQLFSLRTGYIGDGKAKETAICFEKARTHYEAKEAFSIYLQREGLEMRASQIASVEDGFLFEIVATNHGSLWVKYKMTG